jgi:CMP-N,N'-diacetyllegionaminic acid synthase
MRVLYLIPARGGSKGIPHKNIKKLGSKPLIHYSIDIARQLAEDGDICVSTDDEEIMRVVAETGLEIPFVRPSELAADTSGTYEVILHAVLYYESIGKFYDCVVLLQPTSPFRKTYDVKKALAKYSNEVDMVVSVVETKSNPYYVLFEEGKDGFLHQSKNGNFTRRQDCPKVYEYNGSIYVMNIESLKQKPLNQFEKIVKYEMESENSLDLDTPLDWEFAEFLLNRR